MATVSGSVSTTTRNPRHWQLAVLVMATLPEITTSFGHRARSFDHLVGGHEQARRHGQAERLRSSKIEDCFVLGRRLYWKVGWLGTTQDTVDIRRGLPKHLDLIGPV